jgi:hypothetical protein
VTNAKALGRPSNFWNKKSVLIILIGAVPELVEGPLYKLVRDRFNRYYQVKLEGIEGCGKIVGKKIFV